MKNDNNWIYVSNKKSYNHDHHDGNQKKLLCNNILKHNKCVYGDKCMYAHNLNEQNIEHYKKIAYDILIDKKTYDYDLSKNDKLATVFLQLTKLCPDCISNKCSGGYNCKYGAVSEKYLVCKDDVLYGNCMTKNCGKCHVTKFGVKPVICPVEKNNVYECTTLDEDFFIKLAKSMENIEDDSDEDSFDSELLEYLDDYSVDLDESIFIYKKN